MPGVTTSLACCVHAVPERSKTYTAPDGEPATETWGAPTPAVSPDSPTAYPNQPPDEVSVPRIFCCWVHDPPARTKAYAAPVKPSSYHVPTSAVSRSRAVEDPKWSAYAASEAPSLCCRVQDPLTLTKTRA